jgi:hypothetical protein
VELETIVKGLDCCSSSQGSTYDDSVRLSDCISLHLEYHLQWEVRLYFQTVIHWRWALGDLLRGGGVVPVSLPGGAIRVGMGGAIVKVVDFFLGALLAFGTFVLATERSFLTTCLVAVASKPSEPEP